MSINTDTVHVNGQIWIDKNPPHAMMYHMEGVDYELQNQARYRIANGNALSVGNIVALDVTSDNANISGSMGTTLSTVQRLKKAEFPEDSSNILGVITYIGPARGSYYDVAVASDGIIEVSANAFPNDCETVQDGGVSIKVIKPNITAGATYDFKKILGAPVYWFIGRNGTGESEYNSSGSGAMTLYLPSGECSSLSKAAPDDRCDVAYQDLPVIGEIVAYSVDSALRGYTNFRIHLNIQNTYGPTSWYWPKKSVCLSASLNNGVTIFHGLPTESGHFSMETQVLAEDTNGQLIPMGLSCKVVPVKDNRRGYVSARSKNADKTGYSKFKIQGKVCYKGI